LQITDEFGGQWQVASRIPEHLDIARLRSWFCRNGRDDLVVGIVCRGENHIDLAGRESGQSSVDIDIERSELSKFLLQDF
jgi:hypothetical protein